MQSILTLFIFVLILFPGPTPARVDKKPFDITILGKSKDLPGLQKRAELKMARSTAYCRGFYMPKASGSWSCKLSGPSQETCKLKYRCAPTHKNFNRSSEISRLKSELKSMNVSKESLRIKVGRKPYVKKTYQTAKRVKGLKNVSNKKKIGTKIKAPKAVVTQKALDSELDELAKFNEGDKLDQAMVKSNLDKNLSEGLEDDLDDDLEDLRDDADEKTQGLSKNKQAEDSDNKREKLEESDTPYNTSPAKFGAFSLEMIQVADDFDSLVTLGASWTPRKSFNSKIGMRGQFGIKSLKAFSGTILEETFLVYELGMYLTLNFNSNLYAEVGYVLQKWNNTASDSVSAFSVGAGYSFTKPVMKIFDRLFIDYSTVSNDTANRELKFAAGISF